MDYTESDVKTWNRLKEKGVFYATIPGGDGKYKDSHESTKAGAIAWALKVARGGLSPGMTVAEFCEGFFVPGRWDYLNEHPGRSPDYWAALQNEVDTYIIPKWGAFAMVDVKPSSVHAWLGGLLSARRLKRGQERPLSPRSRQSILSTIVVMWNWAVFKEVIPSHLLATIPKPEGIQNKRRAFRLHELVLLFPRDLSQVWPESWGLFFLIAAETGCRPQEVCALRWEDYRPGAKAFIVQRATDRHNGIKELKTARTGVYKKAVPVSDRLHADLLSSVS